MTNVTTLSLQHDDLSTIPEFVHIFPSLQSLYLYGNNLHFIESNSLAGLTSLTMLNIGENHLTRIPFAVNKALNLSYLLVNNNQISEIMECDVSPFRCYMQFSQISKDTSDYRFSKLSLEI